MDSIKEIIKLFESSNLSFLEIDKDNFRVKMKKQTDDSEILTNNKIENITLKKVESNSKTTEIKSPIVGVYYKSPSPESKPFVTVGQKVKKGDVIGLIETMKVISEIKSTVKGEVQEILVEDKQMVAFDEVLIKIKE